MAYATILVRFLSPGRLIKKVGRDVTDGDFVSVMVLFLSTCVVYFIMRRATMRDWVLDHYTSALPNCCSAPFELCDRWWRTSLTSLR